jgi:CheY-like chemotaxis protein/phosphoribosyl 1,2-cyclic phosphodiesterase
MRVRFWGTRGSIATPGAGTVRYGGNTSCVEVTTAAGARLVIDCGTGARLLGSLLMKEAGATPLQVTFLLSHTHWDHINGFPFFGPIFAPGSAITVCGPEGSGRSLREILGGQMDFTYFPVAIGELPASIAFRELAEGTHEVGGVRVVAQFLNHPAISLGYRIEADGACVVYQCDHEPFSEVLWPDGEQRGKPDAIVHDGDRRHARFMAGAGLVIHDAQYTPEEYPVKRNWGHSTYEYALDLADAAGVREVMLTHHDPTHDDAFIDEIEIRARHYARTNGYAVRVACAYEGMELAVEPHGLRPVAETPHPAQERREAPAGRHILVVDDEADGRELAALALRQDGHLVTEAHGGAEALAAIAARIPDLVLLDLMMPQPDGLAVLRALRSSPATASLPVIMVTASDDDQSTRVGFERGADDFVMKPYSMPQLAARVRACLARTEETTRVEETARTDVASPS